MPIIYYILAQAVNNASVVTYIVAWHKIDCVRFISFDNFDDFLDKKKNYGSLHEIILYANENKPLYSFTNRKDGRLCFDFDFAVDKNSIDIVKWKNDVEQIIKQTCDILYTGIDIKKLIFVWSTSDNPTKISKHLTIKELYFEDWIMMSKQFYDVFIKKWDETYNYCTAISFIDKQIIRKNASLRFVKSPKPDGSKILHLDNKNTSFEDSLIRPSFLWNYGHEQNISMANLKILFNEIKKSPIIPIINHNNIFDFTINTNSQLFLEAFKLAKKSTINGNIIYEYRRKYPSYCMICKRIHEHENAFIKVSAGVSTYHCYRDLDKSFFINNDNILQYNSRYNQLSSNRYNKNILGTDKFISKPTNNVKLMITI
jgi:hypothetical protein